MRVNEEGKTATGTILGVVIVLLLAVGMAAAVVGQLADMAPGLGEIVNFDHASDVPSEFRTPILARRDDAPACTLDPAVMAQAGGSVLVEAREGEQYIVHWAGARTSDSRDCGASASLRLTQPELELLAAAAGGFGVRHQAIVRAAPMVAGLG